MPVSLNKMTPRVRQDLLVERLTKDNEKLVEQIALYEAQTRAQAEDTQAAKVSLSEVNAKHCGTKFGQLKIFEYSDNLVII